MLPLSEYWYRKLLLIAIVLGVGGGLIALAYSGFTEFGTDLSLRRADLRSLVWKVVVDSRCVRAELFSSRSSGGFGTCPMRFQGPSRWPVAAGSIPQT